MVKGVNKTVIVVNDTGSKYFEKIVFYVSDEYGNVNSKHLKKAVSTYKFDFLPNKNNIRLRDKVKKRKRRLIYSAIGGGFLLAIIALIIFL